MPLSRVIIILCCIVGFHAMQIVDCRAGMHVRLLDTVHKQTGDVRPSSPSSERVSRIVSVRRSSFSQHFTTDIYLLLLLTTDTCHDLMQQ